MIADATTQLIQRIKNQNPQLNWNAQQSTQNFWGQLDNLIGNAASYAQILTTVEGPVAQAAVASTVGAIATAQAASQAAFAAAGNAAAAAAAAGAGAEAAALATATTAGVGAGIVLVLAFVLAAIGQSGSSQSQEQALLATEIADIFNTVLRTYWLGKLSSISIYWNSPGGAIGQDLDNLAAEGTGGTDVGNDVSHFHSHAQAFVNNLVPWGNPITGGQYWERLNLQELVFSAQNPSLFSVQPAWYGNLPQPALSQYDDSMVADPRTVLPFLLLGINSYLTVEMLVNVIEPSQPTFTQFLGQFQHDLVQYAKFLYSQYTLAVTGLVKSDVPRFADVTGFLGNWTLPGQYKGGGWGIPSDPSQPDIAIAPAAGWAWNGVYGVVDEYPQYGEYRPPPPVAVPSAAPSYIIDIYLRPSDFSWDVGVAAHGTDFIQEAVYPWVNAKITLGLMARWKALYLISGYDKVWPILWKLCILAGASPTGTSSNPSLTLPDPDKTVVQEPTLPDGTKANGNWSARELVNVLNASFASASGFPMPFQSFSTIGYSLLGVAYTLDWIAKGDWTLGWMVDYPSAPHRPISFRDRLAAAAV